MAVFPFLPSLADLRDAGPCKTRQCVWTKKAKKDSPPQQCSRMIADGGKTENILRLLDSSKDFRGILEDLSELQLCGRTHRAKFRELVLEEWIKEIKEEGLKPATPPLSTKKLKSSNSIKSTIEATSEPLNSTDHCPPSRTSTQQTRPKAVITSSILRKILEIDDGDRIECHGHTTSTKDERRCTYKLAEKSVARIATILDELATDCGLSSCKQEVDRLLEELSGLVLCRRYHQDQASEKFEQWVGKIEGIVNQNDEDTTNSGRDEALAAPSTPKRQLRPRPSLSTPETYNDSPESSVSSVWSRSPQSQVTTPDTSPRPPTSRDLYENSPLSAKTGSTHHVLPPLDDSDIENSISHSQPEIKLERQLFTAPPIPTRRSTLRSHHIEPFQPTISTFLPFRPQTPQKMLTALCDVIQRPLSEQDQRLGYIYGFQREGSSYIKIGVSKDIKRRMKEWFHTCRYEPKVVLEVAVPHAFRVERLIHLHLWKERRRESLVAGRCNSGKGCEKVHQEWFEIGRQRLTEIVDIWARFGGCEPYDEMHLLKSLWMEKLKSIDMRSRLDPWRSWVNGIVPDKKTIVAVKTETKEKLGPRVNVSEIKVEDDSDADADADQDKRVRQEDPRILGRGYRVRIKHKVGITKDDPSKGIINTMLDSTLGSGVVSLVAATVSQGVFD